MIKDTEKDLVVENDPLDYISRSNKLVTAQYDSSAEEIKFTFALTEIVQSSIMHIYKENDDKESFEKVWDRIPNNENISRNNKVKVIKSIDPLNGKSKWDIQLDYSMEDYFAAYKKIDTTKNKYRRNVFRKIIEGVASKGVYLINEAENKFVLTHWFSVKGSLKSNDFYKNIQLTLTKEISEYIISRGNYYKLFTNNIKQLEFVYAIRIFDIIQMELAKKESLVKKGYLKRGEDKKVEYEINLFKQLLNIDKMNGYSNSSNLKNKVIEKALKEINEKTNLHLKAHYTTGAKNVITHVTFIVLDEVANTIEVIPTNKEQYIEKFMEFVEGITIKNSRYEYIYNDFSKYDLFGEYSYLITDTCNYIKELLTTDKFKKNKSVNEKVYREFKKYLFNLIEKNNVPVAIEANENKDVVSADEEVCISSTETESKLWDDDTFNNNLEIVNKEKTLKTHENISVAQSTSVDEQEMFKNIAEKVAKSTDITELAYTTWIKPLIYKVISETIYICVPNSFTRDILEKKYMGILDGIKELVGCNLLKIVFEVEFEEIRNNNL